MTRPIKAKQYDGKYKPKYMHAKYDGWWVTVQNGMVFSSAGNLLPIGLEVPTTHEYYGELFVRGQPATEVRSALAHDISRLEVIYFATNACEPELSIPALENYFQSVGLPFAPWMPFQEHALPLALSVGYEGWVYKDGNLLNWYKDKAQHTVDLIVVATTRGTGRNAGRVGALICHWADGVLAGKVSGMDDAVRDMPESELIGRVIEVDYQHIAAKGGMRHARFIRFRDDKGANDVSAKS